MKRTVTKTQEPYPSQCSPQKFLLLKGCMTKVVLHNAQLFTVTRKDVYNFYSLLQEYEG